ncbi:Cadherin-23, partial [Cichlidogyrus casuarinus]
MDVETKQPKLKIVQKLDREKCLGYNLILTAVDSRGMNSSLPIVVRVQNVNDNAPRIILPRESGNNHPRFLVKESDRPGKQIAKLIAIDPDEINDSMNRHQNLDYFANPKECSYSPNEANIRTLYEGSHSPDAGKSSVTLKFDKTTDVQLLKMFDLNPNGILMLKQSLDFEKLVNNAPSQVQNQGWIDLNLKIIAEDSGKPALSTSTTITIRLIDENDNSPSILVERLKQPGHDLSRDQNPNHLYVAENSAPGLQVAMMMVEDKDYGMNGQVSCQIEDAHSSRDFDFAANRHFKGSKFFVLSEEPMF